MAFSYEAASKLFRDGEYLSLIQASGRTHAERAAHEPRQRVLLANSLALVGQLESAQRLAELDRHPPASLSVRSQAESTLCVVERRLGNHNAAQRHAQAALSLAQESYDVERTAWAQLNLFRLLIESGPLDKALTSLNDTRKLVAKAGSNDASAYLHICVSVLEGQIGRLDEARRHCDIAEGLLEHSTNAWLSASCLINRGCIEWLNCRFDQASKLFRVGRDKATKIGYLYLTQAADTCDAHVQLFLGRFEKAEQAFLNVSRDPTSDIASQLGSLDGLARVYLAAGRFNDAERVIADIKERILRSDRAGMIYHVRWAAITESRLLIKNGRYADAISVLNRAEDHFANYTDVPLSVAVHLTQAQALIRQGNTGLAASRILRASELGATTIRDLQAEYYYGSALTISDNPALADHLQRRASRLWAFHDIVAVQHELDNSLPKLAQGHVRTGASSKAEQLRDCVINSLASFSDVAHHPRLLAEELAFVIRSLRCATDVRIVHSETANESETTAYLDVGSEGPNSIWLACTLPDTPNKAILLADVLRMGRAAVELDHARKAERNRAAVWPATPVEEQAGALFVAEEMQTLLTTARRIAATTVPVLITGETGTGKEVLARTIHAYSNRASATFLPFNCSSVPRDMLDSQLFGHRRGSFTGATENFPGVIRAASGGTLFLDEIGETTLEVQPKLLRFLDAGEVHPIGELQPVKADVRVIAATNVDLDAFVTQGRFREDLFYRLNIVRLHVPPLRERRVEIPTLANHYLQKYAHECRKGDLRLAEETMEFLLLYRWPGNVRQLANEMRRMAALAESGAVLMPEHLSANIAASRRTLPPSERALEPTELVVRLDQPVPAAVQHLERTMIQFAMRACGGRMEETAAMLGLSRKGLYLKRIRYGLEPPEGTPEADVA